MTKAWADINPTFNSETKLILCEKAELRGKVAIATLTSNEVFAAKINKFMFERMDLI